MTVRAAVMAAVLVGWGGATAAAERDEGRKLFTEVAMPACAVCHTLKDAKSEGAIGPVLDDLKPDATRVANALRGGIGAMPSYRDTLTAAQIAALAAYVAEASGAAK